MSVTLKHLNTLKHEEYPRNLIELFIYVLGDLEDAYHDREDLSLETAAAILTAAIYWKEKKDENTR